MINNLWENVLLDWSKLGNEGKLIKPELIVSLIFSEQEAEAQKLQEQLLNIICDTYSLEKVYDCTPVALKTLLALLPMSSRIGKVASLNLLSDIAISAYHSQQSLIGKECLDELKQSKWFFLNGIQFDDPNNIYNYVDIVGLLGNYYSDITGQIIKYLELALTRPITDNTIEMITNTIFDLRQMINIKNRQT